MTTVIIVPREASGVRGACSRFRKGWRTCKEPRHVSKELPRRVTAESAGKPDALQTLTRLTVGHSGMVLFRCIGTVVARVFVGQASRLSRITRGFPHSWMTLRRFWRRKLNPRLAAVRDRRDACPTQLLRPRATTWRLVAALALIWLCAGFVSSAWAHGGLHEQILLLTKEIEAQPRDPVLYLRRALLHQAHGTWDAALADLERAEGLSNQWPVLHLARARLFLDAGWYESAKVAADRFLEVTPHHVEALITRARAKVKLGERLSAAEDYARAIDHSSAPGPELFIERAEALAAEGGDHLTVALLGLDQGMSRLGPLVTLQMQAIDVELQQHHVDAALARLDRAMAQFPRKESWLVRRGEILQQAGRTKEATEAFQEALAALDKLPPSRRNVPAMAELEQRVREGLAAANSTPPQVQR